MTYHIGSTKVINLDSAYIHESFPQNVTGVSVKITASDGASSDNFGYSVAVGSGRIVVGAWADDDNGSASGSAYIYNTPQVYTLYDAIDMQSY
jgi:hypothetical protein